MLLHFLGKLWDYVPRKSDGVSPIRSFATFHFTESWVVLSRVLCDCDLKASPRLSRFLIEGTSGGSGRPLKRMTHCYLAHALGRVGKVFCKQRAVHWLRGPRFSHHLIFPPLPILPLPHQGQLEAWKVLPRLAKSSECPSDLFRVLQIIRSLGENFIQLPR